MVALLSVVEYENETIRDLRYLHEIHHAATMPYSRGMNVETMAARNAQNEREASTFSEMAVYLEMPALRGESFEHPIFMDRFLYEVPSLRMHANERLFERWRNEPETVFQELLYARLGVVLAHDDQIDPTDPQVVWMRRYPEQNVVWNDVWSKRHWMVDDAMVSLREGTERFGPVEAGRMHLDWLMSDAVTDGTDVPFHREALAFRDAFDRLIVQYDDAMLAADEQPVRSATSRA
jgi:hypothetical protein